MRNRAIALGVAALLLILSDVVGAEQRSDWDRGEDIYYALGLRKGYRVADIGAGSGYHTFRMAEIVGRSGRIYAVDIEEAALRSLAEQVHLRRETTVEPILAKAEDPRLPYEVLDGALMVYTYHEIEDGPQVLREVFASLRPGARLAIVDFPPRPEDPHNTHVIEMDVVVADLLEAGFRILHRDPKFVDFEHDDHWHRNWLLVGARPLFPDDGGSKREPCACARASSSSSTVAFARGDR